MSQVSGFLCDLKEILHAKYDTTQGKSTKSKALGKKISDTTSLVGMLHRWSISENNGTNSQYLGFQPYLIANNCTDFTDNDHRFAVATRDGIGKLVCYGVPRVAMRDGFFFCDPKDTTKQLDQMDDIYYQLKFELGYFKVMQQLLSFERMDGFCYLLKNYIGQTLDSFADAPKGKIDSIDVIQQRDIKEYLGKDKHGYPTSIKITDPETDKDIEISAKRLILVITKPLLKKNTDNVPQWKGLSSLEPIWDDLSLYRILRYAMVKYGIRFGSPLLNIKSKEPMTADQKTFVKNAVKDANSLSYLMSDSAEAQFLTAPISVDFQKYHEVCLESISSGAEIPTDLIKGVGQGRYSGAEQNVMGLLEHVMVIQSAVDDVTRALVKELSPNLSVRYDIKWNNLFRMDKSAQVKIELDRANINKINAETEEILLRVEKIRSGEFNPSAININSNLGEGAEAEAGDLSKLSLAELSKEVLRRKKDDSMGIEKYCNKIGIRKESFYKIMGDGE